jgi:hypothetical protein
MQHDIKTVTDMIALAKKAREIQIWTNWSECHMRAMKGAFIADLVMNQELGREDLAQDVLVSIDDSGCMWID